MNGDHPRCATCVLCKASGYASWDCSCPIFQQKCHELNGQVDNNNMPYFLTLETWTQVMEPPKAAPAQQPSPHGPPPPPARSRPAQTTLSWKCNSPPSSDNN